MNRPKFKTLQAVKNRRVYEIWYPFYDNPYYFIALQRIAKWLHPDIFSFLDPEANFREMRRRFLPVPYQSGYWLSLEGIDSWVGLQLINPLPLKKGDI